MMKTTKKLRTKKHVDETDDEYCANAKDGNDDEYDEADDEDDEDNEYDDEND